MKNTIIAFTFSALTFILPWNAWAAGTVRCETQYGGNEVCITTGAVQINKKVCDVSTKNCNSDQNYKDNLGLNLNDHVFKSGEQVIYRLYVTNAGSDTFATVQVTDTLPSGLELDPTVSNNSLTYTINNLQPGATNATRITARVIADSFLQTGTNCNILNTASAVSGNNSDQDTTQICISKSGQAITPQTGSGDFLIIYSSLTILGFVGLFLKKILNKF